MNVSEIIDLMIAISPSSDGTSGNLEKVNYLKFLNIVCAELYADTVFYNQRTFIKETFVNVAWSDSIVLSRTPIFVRSVYLPLLKNNESRGKLTQSSLFDIIDIDPDLSTIGVPTNYYVNGNAIKLYPEPYESIIFSATIWYSPDFENLSMDSPASMIPFPAMFHHILANGGLYYLLLDMGGFRDDRAKIDAQQRWEKGKNEIISFIFNASDQSSRLTTYSNL